MLKDSDGNDIVWSNAGKRPSILEFFHLTVVVPLLILPFAPSPYGVIFLVTWVVIDLVLQHYDFTLPALFMRGRIWLSGGVRKVTARRKQQKIRGIS